MTVDNYLVAVRTMKQCGSLPIANFGYKNTKWVALKETENSRVDMRKKNYMLEIENAKRLIPKYAREEREKFHQRLQELGIETKAIKQRALTLNNRPDAELYSRLEKNMMRLASKAASQMDERVDDSKPVSDSDERNDDYNETAVVLKKMASEAAKEDLIFSTEVDTTGMDFSRQHLNS